MKSLIKHSKSIIPAFAILSLIYISLIIYIIPEYKKALVESRKEGVIELTRSAISIMNHFYQSYKKEIIDSAEARNKAIETISYIRYGEENKDYFWIIDLQPVMIMHPYRPELVGTYVGNYIDPTGKKVFLSAVEIVKKNSSGFINYQWQWKDDPTRIEKKTSYIILNKSWNLIIGTGMYLDDIERKISNTTNTINTVGFIILFSLLLIFGYSSYISIKSKQKEEKAIIRTELSEEKYKMILAHANSAIIQTDNSGNITYFNEFAESLFGYEQSEILNQNIVEMLFINKDNTDLKTEFNTILKNHYLETWNSTKSKEKKYIAWYNKPLYDEQNNINGIITIGTDISEQKKILDALTESEERFRTIFNSVIEGIVIFSKKGEILEINKSTLHSTGYTIEELRHIKITDLFNIPDLLIDRTLNLVIGDNGYTYEQLTYFNKTGEPIPIETTITPITYKKEAAYIAVSRNLREFTRIQNTIFNTSVRVEEMERSRIARELHDSLSPLLSIIKLSIQSLKMVKDEFVFFDLIKHAESSIDESIRVVAEISNNLSPHILENFGLIAAIEWYANKIKATQKITISINSNIHEPLEKNLEVLLYRVTTELLNNTVKYSKATQISINIILKKSLFLNYRDNGIGYNYYEIIKEKKGMGLFNIVNRIKSINGNILFNNLNKSFSVLIVIPEIKN
ncbi:MAG: cache domain-containing protein [Bacteroidales bacterium]|nr:cache domain-containing protein [Bacteroidales bacterium]